MCWVTPDLVGEGRPFPWMAYYAARQLGVFPMRTFVKVGDTKIDVAEGHNAGMWTVSIVRTGNEVGLSREQLESLPAAAARFADCWLRASVSKRLVRTTSLTLWPT